MKVRISVKILIMLLLAVILFLGTSGCHENYYQDDKTSDYAVSASNSDPLLYQAVSIDLTDRSRGTGYEFEGRKLLKITEGGIYALTGVLPGGRVEVDSREPVTLILNGVYLAPSNYAAISADTAPLTIHLAKNSINLLGDGQLRKSEEKNACIYSAEDLTLTGSGELTLQAYFEDGIASGGRLLLQGTAVRAEAPRHGLLGRKGIILSDSSVSVDCAGDALRTAGENAAVAISDSRLNLKAGQNGVFSNTDLTLSGSRLSITTGGGSKNDPGKKGNSKGLRAGNNIFIKDGSFEFNCSDTALHSENNMSILSGQLTIHTARTGLYAQNTLMVTGGQLAVSRSLSGIHAARTEIYGGSLLLHAGEQGIRAESADARESCHVRFYDGRLTVYANKEGILTSGKFLQGGGILQIYSPQNGAGKAVSAAEGFVLEDGILIETGSEEQNTLPDEAGIPILPAGLSEFYPEETLLSITGGRQSWVIRLDRGADHLIFAAPNLVYDSLYSIQSGLVTEADISSGFAENAMLIDGKDAAEITLTDPNAPPEEETDPAETESSTSSSEEETSDTVESSETSGLSSAEESPAGSSSEAE